MRYEGAGIHSWLPLQDLVVLRRSLDRHPFEVSQATLTDLVGDLARATRERPTWPSVTRLAARFLAPSTQAHHQP